MAATVAALSGVTCGVSGLAQSCLSMQNVSCNDHAACVLQVLTPLKNHVAAVAPAALIGVACGLLAIAFTIINLKVARARDALLQV